MSYEDRHIRQNRIVRLNTLALVGLILSTCCVGWWIGDTAAPVILSIIRPVDVPEPYYTVQQNGSLGLNDLGVALRNLKMPHKYEKGVFDCSEKAAYVEWFLANRGFNASIYEGNLYEGYRHSWVVVTINNMQVMIETAENSTTSFVCGDGFVVIFVQDGDPIIQPDPGAIIPQPSVVYDNIYAAAKNNGREYDWWTITQTP